MSMVCPFWIEDESLAGKERPPRSHAPVWPPLGAGDLLFIPQNNFFQGVSLFAIPDVKAG